MKKGLIITGACFIIGISVIGVWWTRSKRPQEGPLSVTVENQVDTSKPKAKLELFTGTVRVILPGTAEKVEVKETMEIEEGTKIITDIKSRAQILYPNHTVTRMDANTEITLSEFRTEPVNIKVELEKNRIWSRIPKLLGKESYQTETNTVVATVRGTSYGHGILPDGRDKVISLKGAVEAGCVEKNIASKITKGHKTFFNCGKENEITESLVDDKDKDDWFKFNEVEDKKLDERFGPDTYGDSEDVLGANTDVLGDFTILPQPSQTALIDCKGPDGKTARSTQADCDNLNKFWSEHGPKQDSGSSDNPSSGSNGSSGSTSNPDPTPTPSPSTSPLPDTQGPLAVNFSAAPSVFDGTVCDVNLTFDVSDPSGVMIVSVEWLSTDPTGSPPPSGSYPVFDFSQGQGTLLPFYSANVIFAPTVPPSGTFEWSVKATDALYNESITSSGITIPESAQLGCPFLL